MNRLGILIMEKTKVALPKYLRGRGKNIKKTYAYD
jgi:hypothetical protein